MTERQHAPYRLGLDLGTNSIGWAAIRLNDDNDPCGILDMGVRVFPDGRDAKSKESNAVTRRVARGARRRRDRYQKRRADLLRRLTDYGLMPADQGERRTLAARHDPYELRARALDDPLSPHELGRTLFHLNQRRGFKSNRKADQDSGESGVIKEASEALEDQMAESDARTLGEFLHWQRCDGLPTRFRNLGTGSPARYKSYPTRQMLINEFDEIRGKQEPLHSLNRDQWEVLRDRIFYQRDLKPVEPGLCRFEAGQKRAPWALPVAQEFRILQDLNNLRLRVGGGPERPLTSDQRDRALRRLRSGSDINLEKPTKDLNWSSDAIANLSTGGFRDKIEGDRTAKRLMTVKPPGKGTKRLQVFDRRWLTMPLDQRNRIVHQLLDPDLSDDDIRSLATDEWGLTVAQTDLLVQYAGLPDGHSSLSEKAILKVLPHLRCGLTFDKAIQKIPDDGYEHHSYFHRDEALDRLPYYGQVLERDAIGADKNKDPETDGEPERWGRFPNPTVHIGLNQLRRVVNRLIKVYGKPEEIVVELARDLKANTKQRKRYQAQQREGRERNERYEELLTSAGVDNTPLIRRKLRLWEEQGPPHARVCPYSGERISCAMAMDSRTEIDHILPFSRTLDDSPANKVVCLARANRDKSDRSPFEAFGHSPPGYDYEDIQARAPDNKRWRFEPDAMQQFEIEDRFLDRQLNETRYLSRVACKYLAHLYDEMTESRRRVRAIPGYMTWVLRRSWGLETLLRRVDESTGEIRKQRDDHRHHAIDAFVVANTTPGLLQSFARASAASARYDEAEINLTAVAGRVRPWEGFSREQLQPFLDRLVVSHKPDRGTRGRYGKTTGQLHKGTAYGIVCFVEDGQSKVVVRKQLATGANGWPKTRKNLESVRDTSLRKALLDLWDRIKAERANLAKFVEQAANPGVSISGRRQIVRRVRILDEQRVIPIWSDKNRTEKPYKGYLPGGNEFAEVWRMRDSTWRTVVVPTFDANQPGFDIENYRPADRTSGKPDPAAKRLMRLHIDDMGVLEGEERRVVRVRKITNARTGVFVILDDHNEANVADRVGKNMRENRYSARQLQSQVFRKVHVDEIGRVRYPGPPKS